MRVNVSSSRALLVGAVLGALGVMTPGTATGASAPSHASWSERRAPQLAHTPSIKRIGWGLTAPVAVAVSGSDLFVDDAASYAVTEVNTMSGALVRQFIAKDRFNGSPVAMTETSGYLWTASWYVTHYYQALTLQQFNVSTGAMRKEIDGLRTLRLQLTDQLTMIPDGGFLWVGDGTQWLELNATKASIVQRVPMGTRAFGVDRLHLWGSTGTHAVAELLAATGRRVRTYNAPAYHFNDPRGIVSNGADVFVISTGALTEFNAATGAIVRVITGSQFSGATEQPILAGGSVWIDDGVGNLDGYSIAGLVHTAHVSMPGTWDSRVPGIPSDARMAAGPGYVYDLAPEGIAKVSTSGGALVSTILGSPEQLASPQAVATDQSHVWIANATGNSLTELSRATGALIRIISATSSQLLDPVAVATDGTAVWVANCGATCHLGGGFVSEFSVVTGSLLRVVSLGAASSPSAVLIEGSHVWITDDSSGSLVELDAATGTVQRTVAFAASDAALDVVMARGSLWVRTVNGVAEVDPSTGTIVRETSVPVIPYPEPPGTSQIATDGTSLFVVSGNPAQRPSYLPTPAVVVLSGATGAVVRAMPYQYLANSQGIAAGNGHVWVTTGDVGVSSIGSILEFTVSSGLLDKLLAGSANQFNDPAAVAYDGQHLWVTDAAANSLYELTAPYGP